MNLTISLVGEVDTDKVIGAFLGRPVKYPENDLQKEFTINQKTYQVTFHSLPTLAEYESRIGYEEIEKDLMEVSDVVVICVPSDNLKVVDYTLLAVFPETKRFTKRGVKTFVLACGPKPLPPGVINQISQTYQVDGCLWCNLETKEKVDEVLNLLIISRG